MWHGGGAPPVGRWFSTVILATFFLSSGTFFSLPGLYRQANTRPASYPPSDRPDAPQGENKGGGTTWPASLIHSIPRSPFYTNDLAQGMDDFHKMALCGHDRLDGLVGRGGLVDDIGILTTFHAFRHTLVVFNGEAPLGLGARHCAASAVTAAHETLDVAFAAHDVGTRAHAAGNDSHVAFPRADCTLPGDQNVLAV